MTTTPAVRLRVEPVAGSTAPGASGSPPAGPAAVALDPRQQEAVAARGPLVRVLGGPGTGTTTVAVECVVDRVRSGERGVDEVVLVGATRQGASQLRDRVTARVGGTGSQPLARTLQSLGFGILRQHAALAGRPAPTLLSGAEQDVVLKDLLAGHQAEGAGPAWPEGLRPALGTRGLREELRDLLMRAVEHGLAPADLRALGTRHERPEWVAAADLAQEYDEVTALSAPGAYDPAWVLTAAADLLADDPDAAARISERLRVVVVDDAQELTAPGARLLRELAATGSELVLLGDPDAAVQTFRGADPRHLVADWTDAAGRPLAATTVVLTEGHRLPAAVAAACGRVAARVGALGGASQRGARPADAGGTVEVAVLRSAAQEAAHVAHALRRAHLLDGVPWSELAVVVRGSSRQSTLRRVLTARGVPVAADGAAAPAAEDPAARALLLALGASLALAREAAPFGPPPEGRPGSVPVSVPVSAADVVDLLGGPLVEADTAALRRLRRALRTAELEAGGGRTSDELLEAAVAADPAPLALLGPDVAPLLRLGRLLRAGAGAAPVTDEGWAPGVSAEVVLWAVWSESGLAEQWQRAALEGGARGRRADRMLDAVVGLFTAAAAHQDALPGSGPDSFLAAIAAREVAADSLAARASDPEAVPLLTPQGAAGRQWRRVVVAGVQEGVWPDLRLRGSLLGSEHLVDVVTGREHTARSAREQVRDDETRLLLVALSRATESVLVTAVRSEDEQPSVYLDLVDPPTGPGADAAPEGVRATTATPAPLDLGGVVARLRQALAQPDPTVVDAAVVRLRGLRGLGVRGCHPAGWWALRDLADDRPLRSADQLVDISPSAVEAFHRCHLRWLLTSSGGQGPGAVSAELGTLLHAVAEELGDDVDEAAIHAAIEERWPQLGHRPGWVADQSLALARSMGSRLAAFYRGQTGEWTKLGAEMHLSATVGRARITGRVDRVEVDGQGRVRILDYKTSSTAPVAKDLPSHPQLATYQVAVTEGGLPKAGTVTGGAAIVYLGKAGTSGNLILEQPPLADADDPRWAHQLLEETAEGMGGSSFPARPVDASYCGRCPVRTSCPAREEGAMLR